MKAADQRWTISVISPSPAAFDDFTDPDLAPAEGARRAINNSYLDIQHARHLANNWPQGKGTKSQQSIYGANTLTLQLDWAHRPLWTGTSQLLRLLGNDNGSAAQRAWAQGAVAIVRRISVIMQSHPQDWQQRGNSNSPTSPAQSNGNLPATSPPAGAPNESDKPSPPHEAGHKPSDPPFEPPTAANPNEEDSLCGVILCCA